ncbi:MAG TPA: hypothetical protein PKD37_03620 [Oligoflexia bacterium]|nr:hypothetical protein [Oligoflexia bacterium]HMP27056.1 hypothetical protein [Oligoflexia bacterium]
MSKKSLSFSKIAASIFLLAPASVFALPTAQESKTSLTINQTNEETKNANQNTIDHSRAKLNLSNLEYSGIRCSLEFQRCLSASIPEARRDCVAPLAKADFCSNSPLNVLVKARAVISSNQNDNHTDNSRCLEEFDTTAYGLITKGDSPELLAKILTPKLTACATKGKTITD